MRTLMLLALTAACSDKSGTSSDDADETIVVDGEAYTLILEPVMPPGQSDLFSAVGALEIQVTQGDGSTSTHALGDGEEGSTTDSLPPLEGAVLRLLGRNGKNVVLSGQTPPIDLTQGELTQPISLAQVDTLAELTDMPTGLGFGAVAAVENGRFYLFGGAVDGFIDQTPSGAIIQIDVGVPGDALVPTVLELTLPAISEESPGRVAHTASSLTVDGPLHGQILIAGGTPIYVPKLSSTYTWAASELSTKQALVFDPATETITEVSELAYPRYGHVAVENHLGEVVIIGGFNDQASAFTQAYAEVFDPEDGTFHQISGLLTTGTAHHAAARLGEQGVMVCGGVNYHAEAATECAIISANRSTSTLSFPGRPALGPAMVTMSDERVLYTGGLDMTDETFDLFGSELEATSEAWIFQSGAWRATGSMVHPRAWHTATPLSDGKVLITGGVSRIADDGGGPEGLYWGTAFDPGAAIACAEIYDPDSNTFSELSPCLETDSSGALAQRTLLAGTAVDPDHGAIIMGGIGQDGTGLPSVMLYRPSPD